VEAVAHFTVAHGNRPLPGFSPRGQRVPNPLGWRRLAVTPGWNSGERRQRSDLYKLWDLHIQRDIALMSSAPLDHEMGAFSFTIPCRTPPWRWWANLTLFVFLVFPERKNESALDPGLGLGRPSNSPPPELLNCSLDSFLIGVNGSVVPAHQHHWATRSRP